MQDFHGDLKVAICKVIGGGDSEVSGSSSMHEINYRLRKANNPVRRRRWRGAACVIFADLESGRFEWQEMVWKGQIREMTILSVYSL